MLTEPEERVQHWGLYREQCHMSRVSIKYGPDRDATVAQCCAYLPLPGQIYKPVWLGFLLCFSPCDTSFGQWSS